VANVLREELFSLCTVSLAAASADETRSVSDNPLLAPRVKVKPGAFWSTRQDSTHFLIAVGVV
jgi:hypothetical protein